jgi:alkylation response protein AidB-like acyl-CoA dehydrogenase
VAHSTLTPADAEAIGKPVRSFIADHVIPREQEAFAAGVDDELRVHLQHLARDAGVLAPQAPAAYSGGGADFLTSAVLLEEAGYSPLGPLAMNCAAPDEGNMHLLAMVATEAQKERYLRPLVRGDIRSCFAMTEPPPGAGSDPAALRSTARKVEGGWLLDGDKHFITGADGAGFAIVMARSQGPGSPEGASMFLVDADNPGWHVGNRMRTIDAGTVGGHCLVQMREAFVGDDAVLGEPGRGFAHAQVRLVPARLTHCMRWLGAARRAHDVALRRAGGRELFGALLGSLGMAHQLIADNEIELAACRALLWQVAAQVMQGLKGTEESSRAKVFISEATGRIVDRAVQLAGGAGVTEESVIGRIYADIRAFRIYDGPSEAHRASIARRAVARIQRAPA